MKPHVCYRFFFILRKPVTLWNSLLLQQQRLSISSIITFSGCNIQRLVRLEAWTFQALVCYYSWIINIKSLTSGRYEPHPNRGGIARQKLQTRDTAIIITLVCVRLRPNSPFFDWEINKNVKLVSYPLPCFPKLSIGRSSAMWTLQ